MPPAPYPRVSVGTPGLDDVLQGGIPERSLFLVQGAPGTGKTTLAIQFLLAGLRNGESCLLVSNAETPDDLDRIAASHGWDLNALEVVRWHDAPPSDSPDATEYTLFPAAEVEVGETLDHLFGEIDRLAPSRIVIDSMSALRVLSRDPSFYRRQLDRLFNFLAKRSCTTVVVDDDLADGLDVRTQTLADGFVQLERLAYSFGAERRRLDVRKLRGATYHGGYHDFVIQKGGLVVFPRLVALNHERVSSEPPASSGIEALDLLAGGGLPRGACTLCLGPSGVGKSSLVTIYLHAALERGESCALYLFDETPASYVERSRGLGLDLGRHIEEGRLAVDMVDPAQLTPGQISHSVARRVEKGGRIVVLDTINGYIHGAAQEQGIFLHLRELLSYLSRRGVVTFLTLTEHGILGSGMTTPIDLSFLADNVFLLRYFESRGAIQPALSMIKRRTGSHEKTIRTLQLEPGRVTIGEPLCGFQGVLTGVPVYVDPNDAGAGAQR